MTLRLQELPPAFAPVTPSGEGGYLTVYPYSHPNTDTVYTTAQPVYYVYHANYTPTPPPFPPF